MTSVSPGKLHWAVSPGKLHWAFSPGKLHWAVSPGQCATGLEILAGTGTGTGLL